MRSERIEDKLNLALPLMEWRECANEVEWQQIQAESLEMAEPSREPKLRMRQWVLRWGIPCMLLLVVGGLWLWDQAQRGLDEIETELQVAVDAEPWLAVQKTRPRASTTRDPLQMQIARETAQLRALAQLGEIVTQMDVVDLGQDWAVVQVIVQPKAGTARFRQTRVYQQGASGWVRITPTAEHWGQAHQLESRYFVIHYFTQDAVAVEHAADMLDRLYEALYAVFFSESPGAEKLIVQVDPTQVPGELPKSASLSSNTGSVQHGDAKHALRVDPALVSRMLVLQANSQAALVLASPAATLTPVEMQPSDLLVQSLMLGLFARLADQAAQRYQLPTQWQPLCNGLRLWFIWDQGLALAAWRKPLVKWVFWDRETVALQKDQPPAAFAHNLCASHALWMQDPFEIGVPIACRQSPGSDEEVVGWHYPYPPPLKLPLPLALVISLDAQDNIVPGAAISAPHWAAPIAIATVIEYATTTFGADKLPTLVAALAAYESWETLIPAVFDVSLVEFTVGWHTFLAQHYGVSR